MCWKGTLNSNQPTCITLRNRKPRRECTGALCMQQSNFCSAVDFVYPEPCLQQPQAEHIDYEIIQKRMGLESKRLKKSSSWLNLLQCTNIWRKIQFSCFPVLPSSAEAQVIWRGVVKCLLTAYIIGNICAKKYPNPVALFLRHGVCVCFIDTVCNYLYVTQSGSTCHPVWSGRVSKLRCILWHFSPI